MLGFCGIFRLLYIFVSNKASKLTNRIENLINHITNFIPVSSELKTRLELICNIEVFPKNHFLHKPKRICSNTYFINKGLVRIYYKKNDKEIENIVLRQPTTKDELLKPAWGIFVYYADLGRYSGPGVYLQAQERGKVLHWNKSLTPFEFKELERLKTDGHEIRNVRRGYEIHTTPDSVRSTQLFRTLPHEIGHSVDYLTNNLNPSIQAKTEEESEYISKKYNSKPSHDKEEFAHRYATEFYERFEKKGSLPFPRIYDDKELQGIGLNTEWFNPN